MNLVGCLLVCSALTIGCGKKKDGEGGEGADNGKASSGEVVASCDQREMGGSKFKTCNEYTGSNWSAKNVEAQCVGKKKFIAGPCPKEGVVFSCKNFAGKPSEGITHYYNEAEEAKAACERLKGQPL